MTRKNSLRGEIDTLQAELTRPAADTPNAAAAGHTAGDHPGRDGAPTSDMERLLRDLQSTLSAAADDVEATVASHPLAVLGMAFLLGVLIGRMSGRNK